MNQAIRGIERNLAEGNSFHKHGHPNLMADYALANPTFNVSDWPGELRLEDMQSQAGWKAAAVGNLDVICREEWIPPQPNY